MRHFDMNPIVNSPVLGCQMGLGFQCQSCNLLFYEVAVENSIIALIELHPVLSCSSGLFSLST